MTDLLPQRAAMSRREVERWLLDAADSLGNLGVRGVFGHGPDLGHGASSWISFASDLGSGRVVRHHDGACRVDAQRHSDGHVLVDRSGPVTTPIDFAAVVSAITPYRRSSRG